MRTMLCCCVLNHFKSLVLTQRVKMKFFLCSLVCSSTLTLGKLTVSVLNEHIRCILFRDFQLLMKVSSAHATKSNEFVRSVDK